MLYHKSYRVFYSGCADNTPKLPDYKDDHYKRFKYRSNALLYAHDVAEYIYKESERRVEYGVCEITIKENKTVKQLLKEVIQHQKEILYFIMDETEPNRHKPLGTRQMIASKLVKVCDKLISDV